MHWLYFYISIPSTNGGGSGASSQKSGAIDWVFVNVTSVVALNGDSGGWSGSARSWTCGRI
jgi:hypothetical protein